MRVSVNISLMSFGDFVRTKLAFMLVIMFM